jgi:hypothetical protein
MTQLFASFLSIGLFCLLLLAIFLSLLWYFRRRKTRPAGPDHRYILFRNYTTEPLSPTEEPIAKNPAEAKVEPKPATQPTASESPAAFPPVLDFDD